MLARVTNLRLPVDAAPGQRALWAAAETLLPAEGARLYNSALMELGATLCRPGSPPCLACPVLRFCAGAPHGPETLPIKKPRQATVALREDCAWIVRDGRLLLEQGAGSRWKGLWRLPSLGREPAEDETPRFRLVYPFTHHAVTLRVYPAPAPDAPGAGQAWCALENLETLAMSAPHRRAVRRLTPDARGG